MYNVFHYSALIVYFNHWNHASMLSNLNHDCSIPSAKPWLHVTIIWISTPLCHDLINDSMLPSIQPWLHGNRTWIMTPLPSAEHDSLRFRQYLNSCHSRVDCYIWSLLFQLLLAMKFSCIMWNVLNEIKVAHKFNH